MNRRQIKVDLIDEDEEWSTDECLERHGCVFIVAACLAAADS